MIPPVGGLAASILTLESGGYRFEPLPSVLLGHARLEKRLCDFTERTSKMGTFRFLSYQTSQKRASGKWPETGPNLGSSGSRGAEKSSLGAHFGGSPRLWVMSRQPKICVQLHPEIAAGFPDEGEPYSQSYLSVRSPDIFVSGTQF